MLMVSQRVLATGMLNFNVGPSYGLLAHLVALVSVLIATAAIAHAAMTKNEVRSAIGWVGVILLSPIVGSLIYAFVGVNRPRQTAPAGNGVVRSSSCRGKISRARVRLKRAPDRKHVFSVVVKPGVMSAV